MTDTARDWKQKRRSDETLHFLKRIFERNPPPEKNTKGLNESSV